MHQKSSVLGWPLYTFTRTCTSNIYEIWTLCVLDFWELSLFDTLCIKSQSCWVAFLYISAYTHNYCATIAYLAFEYENWPLVVSHLVGIEWTTKLYYGVYYTTQVAAKFGPGQLCPIISWLLSHNLMLGKLVFITQNGREILSQLNNLWMES